MSGRQTATRREFLRGVGAAAAVIGAPYVISARALGRSAALRASERITLGMIGLGNMGSGHLSSLLGDRQVQIVAVCDVDAVKRAAARRKVDEYYGAAAGLASGQGCAEHHEYEALLARSDIDAVLIAVPDHWHAIVAIAACRAGKDVYSEKPLSLTIREAEAMVAAARRYGTVFQTGSQQRSSENFRQACEYVRSGRIGRVHSVTVNIGDPSTEKLFAEQPVREGLDWDRWLGPAPWQPYNSERCSGDFSGGWRHVRDYSGGMTTDWGAHHFDIAQWGLGMDGTGPVEIIPPPKRYGPGLTYRYANGVIMTRGEANGVLFTGTDGRVEVNRGYLKTWPTRFSANPCRRMRCTCAGVRGITRIGWSAYARGSGRCAMWRSGQAVRRSAISATSPTGSNVQSVGIRIKARSSTTRRRRAGWIVRSGRRIACIHERRSVRSFGPVRRDRQCAWGRDAVDSLKQILMWLLVLASLDSVAPANEPATEPSGVDVLLELMLPSLASDDIATRQEAQLRLEHLCLHAARPGAEDERLAFCQALLARCGDATPLTLRLWLLRLVEKIGRAESVPTLVTLCWTTQSRACASRRGGRCRSIPVPKRPRRCARTYCAPPTQRRRLRS